MDILTILLLIILGLVLLLIEFTVLPGVTIAGIGGFLVFAAAVYIAFADFGTTAGILTIITIIVVAPSLLYYLFKTQSGRKMMLEKNIDSKIETISPEKIKVGDRGKTLGRLAPTGKAQINGEVIEVQSTGKFVDPNTEIQVLEVNTNKVIVEPLKE